MKLTPKLITKEENNLFITYAEDEKQNRYVIEYKQNDETIRCDGIVTADKESIPSPITITDIIIK